MKADLVLRIDEGHRYWKGEAQLPGASRILESVGLIQQNPFWTDEAREKGTQLHSECFQINTGIFNFDNADSDTYFEAVSYAEWKAITGFKVLLAETMLDSDLHRFAGTFDLFGTFPDESYAMIDLKRGSTMSAEKYKLAMYVILLCEHSERLFGKKLFPFQVQRFALDRIGKEKPHLRSYKDKTDYGVAIASVVCFWAMVRDGIQKL